jgi:hypothetical protein
MDRSRAANTNDGPASDVLHMQHRIPWGTYVLDPLKKDIMFFETSACARRTGAATSVERRRRELSTACSARQASSPE